MFYLISLIFLILAPITCDFPQGMEKEILVFTDFHIDYVYNLAEETLNSNNELKRRLKYPNCSKSPDSESIYIGDYG